MHFAFKNDEFNEMMSLINANDQDEFNKMMSLINANDQDVSLTRVLTMRHRLQMYGTIRY